VNEIDKFRMKLINFFM